MTVPIQKQLQLALTAMGTVEFTMNFPQRYADETEFLYQLLVAQGVIPAGREFNDIANLIARGDALKALGLAESAAHRYGVDGCRNESDNPALVGERS